MSRIFIRLLAARVKKYLDEYVFLSNPVERKSLYIERVHVKQEEAKNHIIFCSAHYRKYTIKREWHDVFTYNFNRLRYKNANQRNLELYN
jgi:hypothetical protein